MMEGLEPNECWKRFPAVDGYGDISYRAPDFSPRKVKG